MSKWGNLSSRSVPDMSPGPIVNRNARSVLSNWLRGTMEAVVLTMVCLSPWAFGADLSEFESLIYLGLILMLFLWAARILLEWQLVWKNSSISLCLVLLFLLALWQAAPLPPELLARISPSTVELYDRLLPATPEVLTDPVSPGNASSAKPPVGTTISVSADATRQESIRYLAVLLCFAAVVNNIGSANSLRRLSYVAVANGAALSLFGLIQFFMGPRDGTLYWSVPSAGTIFGPFVNRGHFAFYINICLGLGLGLLLSRLQVNDVRGSKLHANHLGSSFASRLLQDPIALWLSAALVLMMATVPFSLSRGGTVALIGAAAVWIGLCISRERGFARSAVVLATAAAALGLLAWFGIEQVQLRLSTLWSGAALDDARVYWLVHAWPLIRDFPVWGTGYGTFQYVAPLFLFMPEHAGLVYDSAHNEYLEALIEGGLVRLTLVLVLSGLLFRMGYRSFRHYEQGATGPLVLGVIFALATATIHSFFEFGVHMPAIALFLTVIAAQLAALDNSRSDQSGPRPAEGATQLRGVLPIAAAAVLLLLGSLLFVEANRMYLVDQLRRAALSLRTSAVPNRFEVRVHCLVTAAELRPRDAEVHTRLARSYLDWHEVWVTASPADQRAMNSQAAQADRLAIAHYLIARDLCPLLSVPHLRIAENIDKFQAADPVSAYLERAKTLAPSDPRLWYLCGKMEFAAGQDAAGRRSWRRSLELSDRLLRTIVDEAVKAQGVDQVWQLLPENRASLWRQVAFHLYPQPDAAERRRPFLEKALAIYQAQAEPLTAAELHDTAVLHRELRQVPEAIRALEAALAQEPQQVAWRFELAQILHEHGRLDDARHHLVLVLGQQPRHPQATRLLEAIARQNAAGQR